MAFVVTAGELQSIQRTNQYESIAPISRSLSLSPTLALTYEQLWRAQPALRTVTGFLARNVASLGLDPYRRLSDTDRVKATDHPLATLLERPMGFDSPWTKYRLLNTLMHDLTIFDNAFWIKMKGPNGLRGLQPMPPKMVAPLGSNPLQPTGYRLIGNAKHIDLRPDEVVHFHGYNPADQRSGVAPVETLRQILAEEYSATVYREQMWRNGARVAGYITRPTTAPRWSPEARARFRADWQSQYAGDGPATGGTPIMEDGMEFSGSGVTPRDAQYVESRKLTREEVAVAYFVSPVMLGLMDGATFSNVVELHKMLYQDTLPPWLVQISQDIECQLLNDIDLTSRNGSIYVEFNLKGKLNGSFEEQARALQSAVGGPWMTRNEARALNNQSQVDGGDELIVPLNVITGGLASPNDTAPNEPNNLPSNGKASRVTVLRDFFGRQAKAVASRLGAGSSDVDEVFDEQRWNIELTADLAYIGAIGPVVAINATTRSELVSVMAGYRPMRAASDLFTSYGRTRAIEIARQLETL